MKSKNFAVILLILLIGAGAGWIYSDKIKEIFLSPETAVLQDPAEKIGPVAQEEHSVRLPIPPRHPVAPPATKSLTTEPSQPELAFPVALDQADTYLNERLPQLITDRNLLALVNLNYFIQKLVLFIDHLPEKSIPRLHLPITPPKPGFLVLGSGDQQVISRRNAVRYATYVKLVEAIPDAPLLQLYRGLYPLMQEAYRETTGSNAHFNDRFIQVIDDLLQTPEPSEAIKVVPHISRFKYADESLESRSAGQKILLRMGVENTRRVKQKLQQLRQRLARKDW